MAKTELLSMPQAHAGARVLQGERPAASLATAAGDVFPDFFEEFPSSRGEA